MYRYSSQTSPIYGYKVESLLQDNQNIFNLVNGCLKNDRNSQKVLFQMLRKHAFAICFRYLDSLDLIEDSINKSFIQLFRHIDQFDPQKYPDIHSGVKDWLSQIVISNCIDHYRQRRLFNLDTIIDGKLEQRPDSILREVEQPSGQVIIESIRKLPPAARIVFNLSVIEGLSHKEIGEKLGITAALSRSILVSAREMIRKNLSVDSNPQWEKEESAHPCTTPDNP